MNKDKINKNVVWHKSGTSNADRQAVLKQKGSVLWLTGLSGSGKSTLANALEKNLVSKGKYAYVLDGDNIRHGLNKNLGFSLEDRSENIRRIAEVAKLFSDCGIICITAFISPLRINREEAKEIIGTNIFHEIFISTPIEECERRDPKGMYQKARSGEIADFTGISSPYENPTNPSFSIDTSELGIKASVDKIIQWIRYMKIIDFEEDFSI